MYGHRNLKLNFLEPSGPLQACNRTALPFTSVTNHKQKKTMSRSTALSTVTICGCSKSDMPTIGPRESDSLSEGMSDLNLHKNRAFGVGGARGHRVATHGVKQTGIPLRSI